MNGAPASRAANSAPEAAAQRRKRQACADPPSTRLLERLAARTEFRRGSSMLHPECPIEQAVHSTDPAVQAQLMQEIWRRDASVDQNTLLVADPKCLRVLARTERALAATVGALRQRHGAALLVEPPCVRYAHGAPVLEPFMCGLLTGPLRHLRRLQDDLPRRGATITRLDKRHDRFVVEFEAPLGQLLGYGDWLGARFGDAVDASMWLSRYLPIGGGPQAA